MEGWYKDAKGSKIENERGRKKQLIVMEKLVESGRK